MANILRKIIENAGAHGGTEFDSDLPDRRCTDQDRDSGGGCRNLYRYGYHGA